MASSPDKGKEPAVDPPSADPSSGSVPTENKKGNSNRGKGKKAAAAAAAAAAADSSSAATAGAGDEANKTATVRMSQPQIDLFMSFDPPPLEPVKGVSKEEEDRFAKIDAQLAKWEKEIRADAEMVKSQYKQKGYVEYEVDADLFPAMAPPRPGRRRARHGVVVKKKPQGGGAAAAK